MMSFLDEKLFDMEFKAKKFLQKFCEEERGESNIVAVLLLIVIVVGIATFFRKELTTLVTNVFEKINIFMSGE